MSKIKNYINEAYGELKKVSWPKKEEIVGSTWIVILFVIILALVLGAIDFATLSLVRLVIR